MWHNVYQLSICILMVLGIAGFIRYKKINIEKEILYAFSRAFVQVIILSFIILQLFRLSNIYTFLALVFMSIAGTFTAVKHGKFLKHNFFITFFAIFISSFAVIILMIVLHIIENKAEIIIPLGGMVIGNSMNSISLAYDRLKSEIKEQRNLLETILSLGFPSSVAYNKIKVPSIKVAMIPKINNMKALGLVWIPGLMAGMILGGADPVNAAIYQLIIITMILVSSALSSVIVIEAAKYSIFNKFEQIIV